MHNLSSIARQKLLTNGLSLEELTSDELKLLQQYDNNAESLFFRSFFSGIGFLFGAVLLLFTGQSNPSFVLFMIGALLLFIGTRLRESNTLKFDKACATILKNRPSIQDKTSGDSRFIGVNRKPSVQEKVLTVVPFQSLTVQALAGILKVYATAPELRSEIFQANNPQECLEIFIFHLSAIDLALFNQLGATKQCNEISRIIASSFIRNCLEVWPEKNVDEIKSLISERFKFYASSYSKMMGKDGNSAQIMLDFGKIVPGMRSDIVRATQAVTHYFTIQNDVVKFVNEGFPTELLDRLMILGEKQECVSVSPESK